MRVADSNSAVANDCDAPGPLDPVVRPFGFFLAIATKSAMLRAGTLGCTAARMGNCAAMVIGAKSRSVSYCILR